MKYLDLADLAARTDIGARRLRYCVDHELVPERTWFVNEHQVGTPRIFDTYACVFLACAAHLLAAGCKREAIKSIMKMMDRIYPEMIGISGRNALNTPLVTSVIDGTETAIFEVADGDHVRWTVGGRPSSWFVVSSKVGVAVNYIPTAVISIDIGRLRDRIADYKQSP